MKKFLNQVATRFNAMQPKQAFKRVLSAGLLTVMLWGLSAPAQAVSYEKNEAGRVQTTERFDQIQSKTDGMNGFEATDPRRDTRDAKAQTLSDVARRRGTQASDPLEPARDALGNIKESIGNAVSGAKEEMQETVRDLK